MHQTSEQVQKDHKGTEQDLSLTLTLTMIFNLFWCLLSQLVPNASDVGYTAL